MLLFVFLVAPNAHALLASSTDAWEYTNFASYSTSGAKAYYSDARSMFGYNRGTSEGTYTLYADFLNSGTWHWTEWTLNAPVTIGSFNLTAAHDGVPRNINYRGFTEFKLEYWNGATWQLAYYLSDADPNDDGLYGGGVNYTGSNWLELYQTITPVTAQTWRAQFKQAGGPNVDQYASGPRIFELDGYIYEGTEVPEPASMSLLGLGLFGLAGFRRKRV